MRIPKLRQFIDSIRFAAENSVRWSEFDVMLKKYLLDRKVDLLKQVFHQSVGIENESLPMENFLLKMFVFFCSRSKIIDIIDDCDGEVEEKHNKLIQLRYEFDETDTTKNLVDFRSFFASYSVAGGCLRTEKSFQVCNFLQDTLILFAVCSHCNSDTISNICLTCARNILQIARMNVDSLKESYVNALHLLITRYVYIKKIAMSFSEIMQRSVEVRQDYSNRFHAKECNEAKYHDTYHRNSSKSFRSSLEHWLNEAQRTGELFPGRPIIRLDLGFERMEK